MHYKWSFSLAMLVYQRVHDTCIDRRYPKNLGNLRYSLCGLPKKNLRIWGCVLSHGIPMNHQWLYHIGSSFIICLCSFEKPYMFFEWFYMYIILYNIILYYLILYYIILYYVLSLWHKLNHHFTHWTWPPRGLSARDIASLQFTVAGP
jgi:hypothetical protein